MNDRISDDIRRSREFRIHGQYADAICELEKLIEEFGPQIQLVVELGDILFAQGLFSRSIEVLEKHLAQYDPRKDVTAAAGEIILSFARFFATSQFKEHLSHAESIYGCFATSPDWETLDDAIVRPTLSIKCSVRIDWLSEGSD